MTNTRDEKYLRLYHEYAQAIQAYENAISNRTRARAALRHRTYEDGQRRPIGFESNISKPLTSPSGVPAGAGAKPFSIYLGDILGWVTFKPWSPEIAEYDECPEIDALQMADNISLHLYWNVKLHFEKCKRAFFDYVRNKNIEVHKERAVDALNYAANLQLLGAEGADEHGLSQACQEVEAICRNAWALYQSEQEPKSMKMVLLLLNSVAEAQAVGAEQNSVVEAMTIEVNRLLSIGMLSRGRT
jgi:hypothetical protein